MGFRFRKSIKLAPGVRVNLSKSGASYSFGPRGASVSVGKRGIHSNVGIPGTGISYRTRLDSGGSASESEISSISGTGSLEIKLVMHDDGKVDFVDRNDVPLPPKHVKLVREQGRATIAAWLQEQCDTINEPVESRVRIHERTPAPNSRLKYRKEKFTEEAPLPPSELSSGLRGKLFRSHREKVDEENARRRKQYYVETEKWKRKKARFEEKQEENRVLFEERRLSDVEVMDRFLQDTLGGLDWPGETSVDYEIAEDGEIVYLDVDLPEVEDFPRKVATVAARGIKLNIKNISETQTRRNYLTHIHGIGFRLIGEVFAALPSCRMVVLSAYSQRPNKATGAIEDEYLYSVKPDRGTWAKIIFKGLTNVDPIETLSLFELRRNMTKSGIIKAIEPFGPS